MTYGTLNVDQVTNSDGITSGGLYGFKNRIINGAMMIDQRNAGASSTPSGTGYVTIDRFSYYASQASKITIGQNLDSVTPPAGFRNYLGLKVAATATVGASDYFIVGQPIEGYNVADLNFGLATAATVTVSFWVRSSVTGTFGAYLKNGDQNRSYPFTYTISSANTWEQKSITINGDTTGTWNTTNGQGLLLFFGLGVGSTYSFTPNSWGANNALGATGATSIMGTLNATFYITGVQLEKGSTATSFDYRPYGTELALCQRYYYKNTSLTTYAPIGVGRAYSGTNGNAPFFLPVPMRSSPTVGYSALANFDVVTSGNPTAITNDGCSNQTVKIGWARPSVTSGAFYQLEFGGGTGYWLDFSAEL